MYQTILVPTDGSDAASAAAEGAVALAARFGASLHAIHALDLGDAPPTDDEIRTDATEAAQARVDEVAELAAEAGVEATTAVVDSSDPVHEAILGYADDHGVDCIVMGTLGRTGLKRIALGSVAARTVRASPVPVITIREGSTLDPDLGRVLVPIDGSGAARAAADHAIDLATATGAALHVVHVVDVVSYSYDAGSPAVLDALEAAGREAVDEVVEAATDASVGTVEASVLSGRTARSIVNYAGDREVDCIVMGTHGRTGFDRILLGSVTEQVIRLADVPVIGVKSPEAIEKLRAE